MDNESASAAKLGGRRRRFRFKEALSELLFGRSDLAKTLLGLDLAGVLATTVIYYNHSLPKYYLYLISLFLFLGVLSLFYSVSIHKTSPDTAVSLGLIGAACVIAVIPTITAGVLPRLGGLVWVVSFVLFFAVHIAGETLNAITPIDLEIHGKAISDAARAYDLV